MSSPQIVVLGASLGGVMAAWHAAQAGCDVTLVAEPGWLGGQMTAQGVPPDEHPLIEEGGASRSYLQFRADMRAHYRAQSGFLDGPTMTGGTNPGDGWVSRLCIEPAVAAQWFERLLQPLVESRRLRIERGWHAVRARTRGRQVLSLRLRNPRGQEREITGGVFVDATDTGELLALAGMAWRVGKESHGEFSEPDAPARADRADQQPITHVMALRWWQQAGPVSPAPSTYSFWRERIVPHYGHSLFSEWMPGGDGRPARLPLWAQGSTLDWWRYRRVVSAAQWKPGAPGTPGAALRADVSLVNWAQNDYALHPLIEGQQPEPAVRLGARELSLALLHWLHTEAPRPDGGQGWPQWQPAPDVLGTADGLAQQPYVRESRRIVARQTLTQLDLLQEPAGRADSVGIGWYRMDIHPTCTSGRGTNAHAMPLELPLGAFIPADGGNVVPGCKNIGVTHLANACTRVHPIEWLVGEVAGLLAVMRLQQGWPDRPEQVAQLQQRLVDAGIPLHWDAALLRRRRALAH